MFYSITEYIQAMCLKNKNPTMLLAGLLLSLLCLNVKDMSKINTPTEIWKPVVGFEGLYEVSNLGNVKSVKFLVTKGSKRERPLRKNIDRYGYFRVVLSSLNTQKDLLVHRLVAIAFIDNPENKPTVNHKDGIKKNNLWTNLEWATVKENTVHSWKNGLSKSRAGHENPQSKSVIMINPIINIGCVFGSIHEANRYTKINCSDIRRAANGNFKQAGGYEWKYK